MKPLGRVPTRHNNIDDHPQKGYFNFWEHIHGDKQRGERMQAKRNIEKELMHEGWGDISSDDRPMI